MGLRFRKSKECLGEKEKCFYRRENERNETDFALKLFKENASRWIEDLSRFCRTLILDR